MVALVKYEGSSYFVNYSVNASYLMIGNDLINIQPGHNGTIFSYNGDDTVNGSTGNDGVYSGSGNDVLNGNAGNDLLNGQSGNDWIYGGSGNDNIQGDFGNDFLYGGTGTDTVTGGHGDDFVTGGSGDNDLYGGAGNDTLSADGRWDYLYGGDGNDEYRIRASDKSEIWDDPSGTDVIVFTEQTEAELGAVQVGDAVWIAEKTLVEGYISTGVDLSPNRITSGVWVHDADDIEALKDMNGTNFSIDDLLLTT